MSIEQHFNNLGDLPTLSYLNYQEKLYPVSKVDFYNPTLPIWDVPVTGGVYIVRNNVTKDVLVGNANKLKAILTTMRSDLIKDRYVNKGLQTQFNTYSNLEFQLFTIPVEDLTLRNKMTNDIMNFFIGRGNSLNATFKARTTGVQTKPVYSCYVLTHLPTGKFYIGSAANPAGRKAMHMWKLKTNQHHNSKVQQLWNSDPNQKNWQWKFVPFDGRESARKYEQDLIDLHWNKTDLLLNLSSSVYDAINALMTPEVRAKAIASITATSRLPQNRDATAARFKAMWSDPNRRSAIAGGGNPFAKAIIVDGIRYGSVKEAQTTLSRAEKTLRKLANDPKCLTVVWADPQNVTVPKVVSADNGVPKSISIKGIVYSSVAAAIRAIGGSPKTWRDRANSESCSDVFWV